MALPVMPEISQALRDIAEDYVIMKCRYQSALREVRTKLEILDDEFQMRHSRNPIHHMESRIKSPQSIAQKLKRKGLPLTPQAAMYCGHSRGVRLSQRHLCHRRDADRAG